MTTNLNTQPDHGPINGEIGGDKASNGWLIGRPSRRTRIGLWVKDIAGKLADLLLAWFEGFLSLFYNVIAWVAGAFAALVLFTHHPASWAAGRVWAYYPPIFAMWAFGGLLVAISKWYIARTTTPTADLDDVAASYDKLTDTIERLRDRLDQHDDALVSAERFAEVHEQLTPINDQGSNTTALLEQVVDSLAAITRQLNQRDGAA